MNTLIPTSSTSQQTNPVANVKILKNTDNNSENQEVKSESEDFDGLLVSMLDDVELDADSAGISIDVASDKAPGENMPIAGNSLPLADTVSMGAEVNKADSRLLLPDQASSVATENVMVAFSHDNLAATTPGKDTVVNHGKAVSADAFRQLPAQVKAHSPSMMELASQLKNAEGADAVLDDALVEQDLRLQAAKSSTSLDGKLALLGADTEIGRLARQFAQNRLTDKGADKLSAISAASSPLTDDTESLLSLGNQNQSALDSRPITQLSLPQSINSPQWGNDLGERIRWLLSSNIQRAEIRLNPGNLGMIDISISVDKDITHIQIVAQNPLTKDALDASVERLREMLDESSSGQVDIDLAQESEDDSAQNKFSQVSSDDDTIDDENQVVVSEQAIGANDSLIDFYA